MLLSNYDLWKTTPPEERWGTLGFDERDDDGYDAMIEEEALLEFYLWEPL